jgi:hypothetical protein
MNGSLPLYSLTKYQFISFNKFQGTWHHWRQKLASLLPPSHLLWLSIPTYLLDKIKPGVSPKTHISALLKYYLRYLCDGHYSVVPFANELLSAENENTNQVTVQSYFLRKLIISGRSKSLKVVEVLIKQSPVSFEVVVIVKVWLFPLLRLNSSNDVQKDNRKRQKSSKATNEVILLEASVLCAVWINEH